MGAVGTDHNRTTCFLLVSLPSDQSGSLPSDSPAHQPGSECELSDRLGHRPAGCALGQHIFSRPDCEPSTDVSEGTDGEYPAWATAQVGQGEQAESLRDEGRVGISPGWEEAWETVGRDKGGIKKGGELEG